MSSQAFDRLCADPPLRRLLRGSAVSAGGRWWPGAWRRGIHCALFGDHSRSGWVAVGPAWPPGSGIGRCSRPARTGRRSGCTARGRRRGRAELLAQAMNQKFLGIAFHLLVPTLDAPLQFVAGKQGPIRHPVQGVGRFLENLADGVAQQGVVLDPGRADGVASPRRRPRRRGRSGPVRAADAGRRPPRRPQGACGWIVVRRW